MGAGQEALGFLVRSRRDNCLVSVLNFASASIGLVIQLARFERIAGIDELGLLG